MNDICRLNEAKAAPRTPAFWAVAGVSLAVVTFYVGKFLWFLGPTYMHLLASLALVHVVVTVLWFRKARARRAQQLAALGVLFVGQWWAVEMIAMLLIWHVGSFAS